MKQKAVLGIDIGGTNTAFGFVDIKGKLLIESSIPTHPQESAEQLFIRLHPEVEKLFSSLKKNYELVGIGVGAPNANYYKGTVELPPNLNWGTVNIVDLCGKYFSAPCAITNDANAAAIGELKFGAGKELKDFIVITLGTGVGSGIIVNGDLVYGHDGFAGEIGHTIYDVNGRQCGCGRKGCLETYASAGGIKRTVFELLAETNYQSLLSEISFDELNSKMISDAALQGDKIALMAFDKTARILGIKLADAVAHTSPEAVILFGGLANAGGLILEPTKKYMEEYMLNIFKDKVKILPSGLKNGNAAILGSAALIWNELDKRNN